MNLLDPDCGLDPEERREILLHTDAGRAVIAAEEAAFFAVLFTEGVPPGWVVSTYLRGPNKHAPCLRKGEGKGSKTMPIPEGYEVGPDRQLRKKLPLAIAPVWPSDPHVAALNYAGIFADYSGGTGYGQQGDAPAAPPSLTPTQAECVRRAAGLGRQTGMAQRQGDYASARMTHEHHASTRVLASNAGLPVSVIDACFREGYRRGYGIPTNLPPAVSDRSPDLPNLEPPPAPTPAPMPAPAEERGKKVYTTGEVARICQVAPRTVSKWFDSGRLKGYRIPGSQDRRIPREALDRFLVEHGMGSLNDLERDAAELEGIRQDAQTGASKSVPEPQFAPPKPTEPTPAKPLPADSMQLRAHVADTISSGGRNEWTADISSVKRPVVTALKILQGGNTSGSHTGVYAQTARDGILTDGRVAMLFPEKLRGQLPAEQGAPSGARSLAVATREMMAQPANHPVEVVAAKEQHGRVDYLLRDDRGNHVAVDASYIDLLRKEFPGASFHVQDRAYGNRNRFVDDLPIIAKQNGRAVGVVMPLRGGQEAGKTAKIWSAGEPNHADQLFAGLEPSPNFRPENVDVSKDETTNRRKRFFVHNPGNAALEVRQDGDGDWSVREIGHGGQGPRAGSVTAIGEQHLEYGVGLNRQQARDLAVRLLSHAHGSDNGRLLFRARGGV